MMSNPAFLVEGHLEKKFIQRSCPGKTVRLLNCNGKSVSVIAIAKRIATHCRMFHGRFRPIVVCVDREGRSETSAEFAKQIKNAVRDEGIMDTILIGVPDREIENWILADVEVIKKYSKSSIKLPALSDGFKGKGYLIRLINGYHETTTGVDLLLKCVASRMMRSPSFKVFYENITQIDCWWLQR